jgi:ribonuclease HII
MAGIDEVGRGPIAGPTTVGCVCILYTKERYDYLRSLNIRDSKKLSPQKRFEWLLKIRQWSKEGWLWYRITSIPPQTIDSIGISVAIRRALHVALRNLPVRKEELALVLDGGLRANKQYSEQTTIIKGDEKEPLIALASIIAKIHRDSYMERIALKYPEYAFGEHKGYGTKHHYKTIKKHGMTPIHRKSFLGY